VGATGERGVHVLQCWVKSVEAPWRRGSARSPAGLSIARQGGPTRDLRFTTAR
jgi:hypothetical protein